MNHNNSSSSIRRRWALRYGLAFVAVAAGFGLRVALTAWIGPGLPTYITFYPAVMVAALLAGFGPGLLATALTAMATGYWILPPARQFAIASPVDRVGLVLFIGMGIFMSAVAELYRRDRRKAAAYDREIALRETRREKEFLADVLEHASQPFAVGYPDGRMGLCNRAYEQLTGYTVEELRAIDWAAKLTPPEWRELERQKLAELHVSGQPVRYEKEYVRKDGTRVPVELLVQMVKDTGGKPDYYYSFLTDITERKRAETALRLSEERYRTMFNTMLEGFCIIEVLFDAENRPVDYRFLEINPAFEAQTGLRNAQGKRMRELAPEHEAHWFEIYGKVALTGEPARFVNEAKELNRWFDVSAYQVGGPDSRKVAILFSDITERRRAEESTRLLSGAVEATANGIAITDREGKILWINTAFTQLTGYTSAEVAGQNPRALKSGQHPPEFYRQMWSTILRGEVWHGELINKRKDGSLYPEEMTITPVRATGGEITHFIAVKQDITERKRAEETLKKAHAELEVRVEERTAEVRAASFYARSLLEASLDPLVTISPEGKVTDVNKATELVTGVPREQLIGTDFARYFTEPQKAEAGYQKVLAEGQVRDYPLTIRHTSGHATEVLYHATVYRNEAGAVQGVFAAARDITEHKRAEAELARYRDHLEDLVKLRTAELARSNEDLGQFAYVASHDLQEPLRAVGGYVKLLQHRFPEKLDAKAREYVTGAVDGAERMQRLITDLLAFSRVGTRGGAFAPADLNALLRDALNNLQASIKEAGAKVTSDPLPSLSVDATQIVQLFQNLIGNAIKFHSDLTPVIHVGARREKEHWLFWVRDNGIGIEPQYAGRIFQIFQRLHTRKQYPGTGIGLAICKKIVERHGGEIRVESQPEQGSTFYFSIPEISAKKEHAI